MDLLLYGLDEAGRLALAQKLAADQRTAIREVAVRLLERHHTVEVWEGPTCILRLHRRPTEA